MKKLIFLLGALVLIICLTTKVKGQETKRGAQFGYAQLVATPVAQCLIAERFPIHLKQLPTNLAGLKHDENGYIPDVSARCRSDTRT